MVPVRDQFHNAIEAVGLGKSYGHQVACKNVNLLVRSGEIFGFLGPNGAGKSTVVKILLGLVPATWGTARLLGEPYRSRAVRRRVGYLPELFRYPPWLTVREVVTWHAQLAGVRRPEASVSETLDTVGLGGRTQAKVGTLSKGLQQRLGLAVATVGDPDLLFLDEPTSAMDPIGRHEMGQWLRQWRARHKTVFLNSHLLSDMEGLCDRVALIDHGNVLYTGAMGDLLAATPSFEIHTGPVSDACLRLCQDQGWNLVQIPHGLVYSGPRNLLPNLHRELHRQGVAIYEVVPLRQSLESWFLARLGAVERRGQP